jgi:16S rRNA (cytosine1402-N4)-methyltransferase
MLHETVLAIRAAQGGLFLDCTLGGGGHTRAILNANQTNHVFACDRDYQAVERGRRELKQYGDRIKIYHAPFSQLEELFFGRRFNALLADLGTSIDQLKGDRGFSFEDQDSLDMRMDTASGKTAQEIINSASLAELIKIFKMGGVRQDAFRVAKMIERSRPFKSAAELARAISLTVPRKREGKKIIHPATVYFQALRMAVNNELDEIDALLNAAPNLVAAGGIMAVITFHSLEDKPVTKQMRLWESGGEYYAHDPSSRPGKQYGKVETRKAIQPTEDEIKSNRSARSARLRVFHFI